MVVYQSILLAIDLHPACDEVTAKRAVELAKLHNAKLSIVHAIEHINAYGVAQAYPVVVDLEEEMTQAAKKQLAHFSEKFNIPSSQQFIEIGSPKIVILSTAESLKADLIIVGSHGRHGFSLFFGSTASAVMQHAGCDVLSVRIVQKQEASH